MTVLTVLMWLALGWVTGVLSLMQWQVWRARQDMHPMQFEMKPLPPRDDWDVRELDPIPIGSLFTPTPRSPHPTPALEEEVTTFLPSPRETVLTIPTSVLVQCPACGLSFKRLSQHMRVKHPVTPSDSTPE